MKLRLLASIFACATLLTAPVFAQEIVSTGEAGFSPWQGKKEDIRLESGHEGKPGLHFKLEENAAVARRPDVADWSNVGAVSFWVFSERANKAVFGLALTSENPSEPGWHYFILPITVNWEGWKHFVVKPDLFKVSRSPSWSNITRVQFSLGWPAWCVAVPGDGVIISDLKLLSPEEVAAQ